MLAGASLLLLCSCGAQVQKETQVANANESKENAVIETCLLYTSCVIASQQGVEHLEKLFPGDEVTLWCAAIDPERNEHSYIVPGLGDAGDLSLIHI